MEENKNFYATSFIEISERKIKTVGPYDTEKL